MASLHELAEAERASDGPPLLPTLIEAPALPAGSCIQTRSRNLVHRKATVCGAQHVVIDGRSIVHEGVVLRGDLAKISIGRFTTLGPHAILRPPHRLMRDEDADTIADRTRSRKGGAADDAGDAAPAAAVRLVFLPVHVGSHVDIGARAVVEAARIGNGVTIGAGAIIGKSSILSDYVTVAPGAIVPPDTVAPPFALLHGVPAEIVGAMPESALHERRSLVEERVKAQLAAYSSAAVPASPSAR